jgi:hypothetical protein
MWFDPAPPGILRECLSITPSVSGMPPPLSSARSARAAQI